MLVFGYCLGMLRSSYFPPHYTLQSFCLNICFEIDHTRGKRFIFFILLKKTYIFCTTYTLNTMFPHKIAVFDVFRDSPRATERISTSFCCKNTWLYTNLMSCHFIPINFSFCSSNDLGETFTGNRGCNSFSCRILRSRWILCWSKVKYGQKNVFSFIPKNLLSFLAEADNIMCRQRSNEGESI